MVFFEVDVNIVLEGVIGSICDFIINGDDFFFCYLKCGFCWY